MFLLLVTILIISALLFVLPPLFGKRKEFSVDKEKANLKATRIRLDDIEKDLESDLISQDELRAIREEAKTTLLMEEQEAQRSETAEKSVIFHRLWTVIIAIGIPVFSILVYLSVGTPTALLNQSQSAQSQEQQLDQLVTQLEKRLTDKPDDQEGWLVLAQTNMLMGRFPEAVKAMENLYQLTGDNPDVLARYADALTMANGGRFSDQSSRLLEKALELDSNHTHALWLAGMNAYQNEQFQIAVNYFQKAKANVSDSEDLTQLDQLIEAARERGDIEIGKQQQAIEGMQLNVAVDIDPSFKDKTNPDDSLFVFAKAVTGPPMPLAVSKHKASELPLKITLNDAMAMMPELKLSAYDKVIISARISKSDQPIAQVGDFQGESDIINPDQTRQVSILIDQIVEQPAE